MTESRYRFRGTTPPRPGARASVLPAETDAGIATLQLYDPIDSWGGDWGVSAKEFAQALADLPEDTEEIHLRINSPGGEVFEAVTILNLLRTHKARVVAHVDGLAASAASFLAAGADEVVMGRNTQLMIHDAWGIAIGNAAVMTEAATRLGKLSDNIASVYADKAGGDVATWREAMLAETWFSPEEAVEAGLADRVEGAQAPADKNRFDLSVFAHKGRENAPDPTTILPRRSRLAPAARADKPRLAPVAAATTKPPAEPVGTITPNQEGADDMSDIIQGLRERLGIPAENSIDEDGLMAALDEALAERAEPQNKFTPPEGTVLVDAAEFDDLKAAAKMGREAREQQVRDERMALVDAAVADGRIAPARRDHWVAQLEADPGAAEVLNSLAKGTIPLEPKGFTGGVDEARDEDDALYSKAWGTPAANSEER